MFYVKEVNIYDIFYLTIIFIITFFGSFWSGVTESDLCSALPSFSFMIISEQIYVFLYSWLCFHVKELRNVINVAFSSLLSCRAMGHVDSDQPKLPNGIAA